MSVQKSIQKLQNFTFEFKTKKFLSIFRMIFITNFHVFHGKEFPLQICTLKNISHVLNSN